MIKKKKINTLIYVHVYQNFFQVPVEVYAQYCHKKVEKMTMTGAKKGLRKPTLEEIVQAKVHVYKKSINSTKNCN